MVPRNSGRGFAVVRFGTCCCSVFGLGQVLRCLGVAVPVGQSGLGCLGCPVQARRGARRSRGALRVLHGTEGDCKCEGGYNSSVWLECAGCLWLVRAVFFFFNMVMFFLFVSGTALFC